MVEVPARGRYNAWFAGAAASLQLRRASFRRSGAAMRRLCPSWASAMSLPWGEARVAHSMPSTFRMRASHWLAFAAWRAIVWQPLPSSCGAETVFECGVGECSAHVADAQPLASPRTGCRTGDPSCLDLDLRLRDAASAPAAPRWRKAHRGRCSAPLAIRDFVARGGGAELCAVALGSGTLCKTGFPARGGRCPGGALGGFGPF